MSNDVSASTPKAYGPFFLEYSLMAEYNLLRRQSLPGVYIIPSAKSPLLWFGVIFVRQGLYQSGVFKFCISIPANYPDAGCPQVIFDHPPFHPVIDRSSGKLDVDRAFPNWKRNVNHIWNVLLYCRRIFYKIDIHAPLNPEAAVLYQNKLTTFKSRVLQSIETSRSHLFDPPKTDDPHEFIFTKTDDNLHDQHKKNMLASMQKNIPASNFGMSWVASGTPFSKSLPSPPQTM